jgi:uncharacterized protein YggE
LKGCRISGHTLSGDIVKPLLLLLLPAVLFAQQETGRLPQHVIRATGEATVNAKPDQARISIGVTTQSQVAQDAVTKNAEKSTAIMSALKSVISGNGEMRTTNYSVSPEYKYEQNHAPVITGYTANQTVEATLNDITLVGKLIDASTKAGANNINQIEFTLKDGESVKAQAIAKATVAARTNAETIAKALGVGISGVAWAETTESSAVRPLAVPMMKMAMAADQSTPIESGNLQVHASVTVALQVQ